MAPKSKKERKNVEKTETPKQQWALPPGQMPRAAVVSRHGADMVSRSGKGFSMGELEAAAIPGSRAESWRLPLDTRRRSILDANVSALRGWASGSVQRDAKMSDVKKVEAELAKVEKKVEQEVVKEAGKVKRGAKKAEKEVAAAVEKPVKARRKKKDSTE